MRAFAAWRCSRLHQTTYAPGEANEIAARHDQARDANVRMLRQTTIGRETLPEMVSERPSHAGVQLQTWVRGIAYAMRAVSGDAPDVRGPEEIANVAEIGREAVSDRRNPPCRSTGNERKSAQPVANSSLTEIQKREPATNSTHWGRGNWRPYWADFPRTRIEG